MFMLITPDDLKVTMFLGLFHVKGIVSTRTSYLLTNTKPPVLFDPISQQPYQLNCLNWVFGICRWAFGHLNEPLDSADSLLRQLSY